MEALTEIELITPQQILLDQAIDAGVDDGVSIAVMPDVDSAGVYSCDLGNMRLLLPHPNTNIEFGPPNKGLPCTSTRLIIARDMTKGYY